MESEPERPWHFDSQTKKKLNDLATPVIIRATEKDIRKVVSFYQHHPVPGYEIKTVEVIYSEILNRQFYYHLKILQSRTGKTAFAPTWASMDHIDLRIKTMELFQQITKPYEDPDFPNVSFIPGWHGTSRAALGSIPDTGYANFGTTDNGFFGKGFYSAHEAEYAYRVYFRGALILNWVAVFSPLPVVADDMKILQGKGNYKNYDAHFVPVVSPYPGSPSPIPCQPDQMHEYIEIVVFESAACLPRYSVTLEKTLLRSPAPVPGLELFQQGHEAELLGNLQSAQALFLQVGEAGYPPAYVRLLDLKHAWDFPLSLYTSYLEQVKKSINWLMEAAKTDPIHLSYYLGRCYDMGWGVNESKAEAWECYQQGLFDPTALLHYRLAWCYEKGFGANKDETRAVHHYQLAANQGYAPACTQLGYCYQEGIGFPKPCLPKALELYLQAASKNHSGANVNLAYMNEKGIGVEKNDQLAIGFYKKAAKQGHVTAQLTLGCIYEEGKNSIAKDIQKAIKYYRLAADQGSILAREQLYALQDRLLNHNLSSETNQRQPNQQRNKSVENSSCILS